MTSTVPANATITSVTTTTITTTDTSTTATTTIIIDSQDVARCNNPFTTAGNVTTPAKFIKRATTTSSSKTSTRSLPSCLATYSPGAILSSACSCLSVPTSTMTITASAASTQLITTTLSLLGTTTTTPLNTSTSTYTATQVSTVYTNTIVRVQATVTATTVTGTFQLVATASADPTINGAYATNIRVGPTYQGNNLLFGATQAQGDLFQIDSYGHLGEETGTQAGNVAASFSSNSNIDYIHVNSASNINDFGFQRPICSAVVAADGTCPVQCSVSGRTVNYDTSKSSVSGAYAITGCGGGYWALGTSTSSTCPTFEMLVVPQSG
ncbi:hypothetical protein BAUCODRAFT_142614 [Baudoinia panamericana UAMH 10762]|uniref:Uncharacterized protein n=1 Tax=Baudoinia panamericana (strain UAMH 10762) TaxID=717646 RepID=M2N0C2_BAUPA|nr:uncharacterized protein BAUCODRAFT_142614 [Baudoinia panamericana UAMH 10762]EMC92020.1 hypothetical protein BAUCODRAFT_142614 [Baudoinia panamericana UAMH 10762]